MTRSLSGKSIIVTGATSGIGRAMAEVFAREGAGLCLVGRSGDRLKQLTQSLKTEVLSIAVDLTRAGAIDQVVQAALDRFGAIDIVMANAGMYISGRVDHGDPNQWDELFAVNSMSVFRLVRAALPSMIGNGRGDIVITSSIAGHSALPDEPIYSASKHAVQAFVHAVRRQLIQTHVRISAIAPGTVANELWGYHDEEAINHVVSRREALRSEDVAEAALWLLTRPAHVSIRDLVILPQAQDI